MPAPRIAQAQIDTTVGDFSGNVKKILAMVAQAKAQGADLLVFPEMVLCGYPPEDLLFNPAFLEDNDAALQRVVSSAKGVALVLGAVTREGSRLFNSACLIQEGRLTGAYHKIALPNYGVFDEKRYFTAGREAFSFSLGGVSLCLTVCEDIWVEGGEAERGVAAAGPDITLNISASPFHAGKSEIRRRVATGFAERTGSLVCMTNLVGGQDELVFDGGSFVVNPGGEILACARRFEEDLLVTDLALAETVKEGFRGARGPREPLAARKEADLSLLEEIHGALLLGTRDYVSKNGFHEVVVGLSGGIDSSLTAALAAEALGPGNVIGVTMPSRFTSQETLTDARGMARNLGIRLLDLPIDPIYQAYLKTLDAFLDPQNMGIAEENLQARIRGNLLMALSNTFGWLVLTTGNKSEVAVGYCTLYGDMAGGFGIIKDLPKTLVYALSAHINARRGEEVIPQEVMRRPPTAELRPGQKDEDSLPPYPLLDEILRHYVEDDRSAGEILGMGFPALVIEEVVRRVDGNEYKRRQAAPGIKITPKAFGRDRRLPVTNQYRATNRVPVP